MNLTHLVNHLIQRLTQPLPGQKAQLSLMSEKSLRDYDNRIKAYEQRIDPTTARQSSVLILLYEKEGQVCIPLIKRPEYEGVHSGQIAFPGGKAEPDDVDLAATALREAYEEVGIRREEVKVLGMLTPVFIPPSNFWVHAVLAYTTGVPDFVLDQREVAALIELPIHKLEDAELIEERTVVSSANWSMKATGYAYQQEFIWGATSMLLTELRALLAV